MMLVSFLMIFLIGQTALANNKLTIVEKIGYSINDYLIEKGYNLSEDDLLEIIKIIKGQGYILSEEEMIKVAQTIKDLQQENTKLKEKEKLLNEKIIVLEDLNQTIKKQLLEERNAYDEALQKANETIKLQTQQINNYKEIIKLYEEQTNPGLEITEKFILVLAGAGIISLFK